MFIAGRLYLKDFISVASIKMVEERILWIKTEKKMSIVYKYLKDIIRLLTNTDNVRRRDLKHIDKVLKSAGFNGSKEEFKEEDKGRLDKIIRWLASRIGNTPKYVSDNMELKEVVPFTRDIARKIIEDCIQMVRASHDQLEFSKYLSDELQDLNEDDEKDGISEKKEPIKKLPTLGNTMRQALMAK